jgi:hypothetical protein
MRTEQPLKSRFAKIYYWNRCHKAGGESRGMIIEVSQQSPALRYYYRNREKIAAERATPEFQEAYSDYKDHRA